MKILDLNYEDLAHMTGKHMAVRSSESGYVFYGTLVLRDDGHYIDLSTPTSKRFFGPLRQEDEIAEFKKLKNPV